MEEDSKYFEKRFFGMIAVSESGPEFITRRDDRLEDYVQFYRESYASMVKRGLEVYRSLIRQLNECKLSSYDVSYVCALLEGMPDPDANVDFPHFYCHPPTFLIYLEAAERLHKHLVFASDTKRVQFVTVV